MNTSQEKRDGKANRRKGKDSSNSRQNTSAKSNQHAAFSNPPSVPSTKNLQPYGELICIIAINQKKKWHG